MGGLFAKCVHCAETDSKLQSLTKDYNRCHDKMITLQHQHAILVSINEKLTEEILQLRKQDKHQDVHQEDEDQDKHQDQEDEDQEDEDQEDEDQYAGVEEEWLCLFDHNYEK